MADPGFPVGDVNPGWEASISDTDTFELGLKGGGAREFLFVDPPLAPCGYLARLCLGSGK